MSMSAISNYRRLFLFRYSVLKAIHLSTLSKSYKPSHSKQVFKSPLEKPTIASLFHEITDILGADSLISRDNPYVISNSKETRLIENVQNVESDPCTQTVRGNAELGQKEDNLLEDVSPLVHAITQVVRADHSVGSMETRLENSGFVFEPEVVEKVLKRCFKVPHMALRFFNWLKQRDGFSHTSETYNTMLYIAGEAREFELVEKLVKEMEENSCEMNIKTWTILLSQYGKAKMIGKALSVFEKMVDCGHQPDTAAYKAMIRSLCIAGKGDVAFEFYKEMVDKEMFLDSSLYKMLMNTVAATENVSAAFSLADDMVRICQIPEQDVYRCLLKSFCVSGRIREALELVRDLKNKDISLDKEYFTILVKGLCRADRITDALEIVDIMTRKKLVDAEVYGIIINGFLRSNDVQKALEMFQNMKEFGHTPTSSTYTELMQRLFPLNEYQKGCDLYNEMVEKRIELDTVAITAVVAGHIRNNRVAEAWKLFKSMKEKGMQPTWKSYSVFIKELCRVSRTGEILHVLNEMQASKISIGDEIFNWVISCMEKKGETDRIEKVNRIRKSCEFQQGKVPTGNESRDEKLFVDLDRPQPAHNTLVAAPLLMHSEQDVQQICSLLSSCSSDWSSVQESIENSSIRFTPELVTEILRKCSVIHNAAALGFFSWVGKQTAYQHTTEAYNMAIKIAGRGKDFRLMRSLFFEMRRSGCVITTDTWTIMIMQYGKTGLTDIVLRTFTEMKASGCNPNGSTYKCVITVLCGKKGRKEDEVVKIFNEMIHAGFIPDKELVQTYLGCLSEVGKLDEARNCLDFLRKAGFGVPLAYSMFVRALCRARRLEEAFSLLNEVETERVTLDQYTYGSIVHALLQQSRLEDALLKMESMKKIGINPTVHVYTALIVHFFKEKQIEKALETFETMKQEGVDPTVVTYSAMIRGYMNMGKVSEAWDIFNSTKAKGPLPDFKTYTMLISSLCVAGKSEEALKLLSEMEDNGIVPSTVNFRTVFFGLNREGKHSLAQTVWKLKSALMSKRKLST